jgi:hypothetical protein
MYMGLLQNAYYARLVDTGQVQRAVADDSATEIGRPLLAVMLDVMPKGRQGCGISPAAMES